MKPVYWEEAARTLIDRDPVLRALIERFPGVTLRSRGDAFSTLARAIVGQQISVKAADSVWQRFLTVAGVVAPRSVVERTVIELQRVGLSARKAAYLQDLARHFLDGTVNPGHWSGLDDDALIAELTRVRGIGRWTAEMFLIFHLQRPNILPVADLGLRKAVSLYYNRGRPISVRRLQSLGRTWAPWRTVATWYLWRSLDPVPVEY